MSSITKTGTLKFIVDNSVKKNNEKSLLRCFNNTYRDLKLDSKLGDIIYNYVNIYHKQIWEQIQAIIICNDELQKGDVCYSEEFAKKDWAELQLIVSQDGLDRYKELNAKKVLAQNHQLSPDFINDIISGKVKEGDKVEVEIIDRINTSTLTGETETEYSVNYRNGLAVIHPYKQSAEEVAKAHKGASKEECSTIDEQYKFYEGFLAGAKWYEEQLKNS